MMAHSDASAPFERLYDAAAGGGPALPWDRGGPHPLIEEHLRAVDGAGRRALLVGSGLGTDAEFVAGRGFAVTAFDFVPAAIDLARQRHPDTAVDYRVADLLHPPAAWAQAFELVVESLTVQSLPIPLHAEATRRVASFVAPGGTLLVVATAREADEEPHGPPWPLTRAEVEAFATGGVERVRVEAVRSPGVPSRWRAEFRRPPAR